MKSRKGKVYKYKKQMNENVIKERRDKGNARERRRMIQLRIAYLRLKEYLPKNSEIKSKKQIVDQVACSVLLL